MSWLKAPTRPAPRLRDYANLIHILKLTGRVRCGEPSPPFQKTADARKHVLRLVRGKRLKRRAVPCGRGAVAEEILKLLAPPRRRHQLGDEMAAALVGEHARQVIGHVGSLSQGHAVRSSLRYHSPESLCADRSHQSRGMVGTAVAVRGELHRQRSKSMHPDRPRQVRIARSTSDSRLPSACHAGGLRDAGAALAAPGRSRELEVAAACGAGRRGVYRKDQGERQDCQRRVSAHGDPQIGSLRATRIDMHLWLPSTALHATPMFT